MTDEQQAAVLVALRSAMNVKGLKKKSRGAHSFEEAFLLGVNATVGAMKGEDPQLVHLPAFWGMCIMSGRSVVEEEDKRCQR